MSDKLIIFFIYLGAVVYGLIVFVTTWHLVTPESWHWLTSSNVNVLGGLSICGLPFVGLMEGLRRLHE